MEIKRSAVRSYLSAGHPVCMLGIHPDRTIMHLGRLGNVNGQMNYMLSVVLVPSGKKLDDTTLAEVSPNRIKSLFY